MFKGLSFLLAGCLCLANVMYGQSANATIDGKVTDFTGAVIPNATISAKNNGTNVVRTAQSNPEGFYSIPNLIPGTYTINAQFQGMKNSERGGVGLRVGDRLAIDFALEVGAQTDRITVTGEAPLLRVEDVQSGLVIDNRRISELPQYNRNPLAFAFAAPSSVDVVSNIGWVAAAIGHAFILIPAYLFGLGPAIGAGLVYALADSAAPERAPRALVSFFE